MWVFEVSHFQKQTLCVIGNAEPLQSNGLFAPKKIYQGGEKKIIHKERYGTVYLPGSKPKLQMTHSESWTNKCIKDLQDCLFMQFVQSHALIVTVLLILSVNGIHIGKDAISLIHAAQLAESGWLPASHSAIQPNIRVSQPGGDGNLLLLSNWLILSPDPLT